MKHIKLNNQSEDETLVNFLQTYNPSTPPKNHSLEDELINSINEIKQKSTTAKQRKNWLFTGTIATVALMILSGNALRHKLFPQAQLAQDLRELESFMVNSWNGAMVEENQDIELYFATFEGEF